MSDTMTRTHPEPVRVLGTQDTGASRDTSNTARDTNTARDSSSRDNTTARDIGSARDMARGSHRSSSRVTLQPSVHDFNGNILTRGGTDEDQVVWLVGKNHYRHTPPSTDYAYPVPASFRRGGVFNSMPWESRPSFIANGFKTDRINAWTEEVHRRHVARTARVRARLSPKPRVTERVIPTPSGVSGLAGIYDQESSFTLSLPDNAERDLDDVRLASFSRTSSRNDVQMTSRSRPATTGRYFDSSNGLRNIRPSPAVFRSRPNTASACSGPGLKIKKMTLHHKELVT